jgi:hypothetical protein
VERVHDAHLAPLRPSGGAFFGGRPFCQPPGFPSGFFFFWAKILWMVLQSSHRVPNAVFLGRLRAAGTG